MQILYKLYPSLLAPVTPGAEGSGSITALVLYITLALAVSFLCSILEAALLSTSQSHIELLVEQGKRAGRLMQIFKQDVDRPISAILTLNTIAHTVGAAGAGAQAAAIFGNQFLGLISAILTLLILVLSEIIPKTLGAVYWKQLTTFTAYTIQVMMVVLYPAVWVFEWLTRKLRPEKYESTFTRDDLEVMAKISAQEGTLEERENRVLRNLFHLDKVQVEAIMTPRTVVMALPETLTIREAMTKYQTMHYSRIPIYTDNIDNITGYVLRHQVFLQSAVDHHHVTLKELAHHMHIVPETAMVADVLDQFITDQEHIFLVIDEYGGTAGIITLEDVIEALLGTEITDESDVVEDLRKLAQERYQRRQRERSDVLQTQAPDSGPTV